MTYPQRDLLKCPKCGYKWLATTKAKYVLCPKCRAHRKRESFEKEAAACHQHPFPP